MHLSVWKGILVECGIALHDGNSSTVGSCFLDPLYVLEYAGCLGTVPSCCVDPSRVCSCAELCSENDQAIAEEVVFFLNRTYVYAFFLSGFIL